jgi:hypothetical protein
MSDKKLNIKVNYTTRNIDLKPATSDDVVCDFCSDGGPHWVYEAEDFSMGEDNQYGSIGAWGACEACHKYIQYDDREKLLERAVERLIIELRAQKIAVTLPRAVIARIINESHTGFFQHRLDKEPALYQKPVGSA